MKGRSLSLAAIIAALAMSFGMIVSYADTDIGETNYEGTESAYDTEESYDEDEEDSYYTSEYIFDLNMIIDDDTYFELEDEARRLSNAYNCGVYAVIIDKMSDYACHDIEEFSEYAYENLELGKGDAKNGVLYALSIGDRKYDLLAYGDFANTAFTDYGKEKLNNRIKDKLSEDDWSGAIEVYLEGCGDYLAKAKEGKPVDVYKFTVVSRFWTGAFLGLLPSFIIAFFICGKARLMLKSVRLASSAASYSRKADVDIRIREDKYTHTTTRVVKLHDDDDDSSGGSSSGGTTVNDSGYSHSSGSF